MCIAGSTPIASRKACELWFFSSYEKPYFRFANCASDMSTHLRFFDPARSDSSCLTNERISVRMFVLIWSAERKPSFTFSTLGTPLYSAMVFFTRAAHLSKVSVGIFISFLVILSVLTLPDLLSFLLSLSLKITFLKFNIMKGGRRIDGSGLFVLNRIYATEGLYIDKRL